MKGLGLQRDECLSRYSRLVNPRPHVVHLCTRITNVGVVVAVGVVVVYR